MNIEYPCDCYRYHGKFAELSNPKKASLMILHALVHAIHEYCEAMKLEIDGDEIVRLYLSTDIGDVGVYIRRMLVYIECEIGKDVKELPSEVLKVRTFESGDIVQACFKVLETLRDVGGFKEDYLNPLLIRCNKDEFKFIIDVYKAFFETFKEMVLTLMNQIDFLRN